VVGKMNGIKIYKDFIEAAPDPRGEESSAGF
jgi:hypothetical protein